MSKKEVSKIEFGAAFESIDNKKIIKSVCKQFRKQLPQDTLYDCGIDGLYHCLQYYDGLRTSRCKFTTYLYQFVLWECIKAVKKDISKHKPKREGLFDNTSPTENHMYNFLLQDTLSILNDSHKQMVLDRFIGGKTFVEIGLEHGVSKQKARAIVIESINRLRNKFDGV